jgi:hypothetical protein
MKAARETPDQARSHMLNDQESMKKSAPYASLALVSLASSMAIAAQDAKSSDTPSLVYVYRYKQVYGMAIRPSIYCDDKEIARLQNGRYLALALKPGKHGFRSNDKQSVIDLDMKADQS